MLQRRVEETQRYNNLLVCCFASHLKNIWTVLFSCASVTQASHTHDAIAEAAQLMKEAVDDIMVTLNEAASEVGMVGGMVESIADAMAKVSAAKQNTGV